MFAHLNEQYTPSEISTVWNKATWVSEENEVKGFRKDLRGAWILKSEYGNRQSQYGWEVDHIKPVAAGGTSEMANLQPLHWENNCSKGDIYPGAWPAAVTSQGNTNIKLQ